ncbi:MAG: S8 family serine peptidase [Bacteroidota bacterium]
MRYRTGILLSVLCLPTAVPARAAETPPPFFIYHGKPFPLELDPSSVAVLVEGGGTAAELMASLPPLGLKSVEPGAVEGWFFLRLAAPLEGASGVEEAIERIGASPVVELVSPVFLRPPDGWMVLTPDILLRFREPFRAEGDRILSEAAPDLSVVVPGFGKMAGAYLLRSGERNGFRVLAAANRLALDPRVEWAEPDAMFTGRAAYTPNDPGFPNLWGIRNTLQFGGIAGMDMDGDLAWDYTSGSTGIKVLVIDTGVQQNHPDIHQLAGADMTGQGGGGGPVNACDNHGTAVAGCVSATMDNSLGTVGIAPGSYVLSARTFISNLPAPCSGGWTTNSSWTVNALAWGESLGCRVSNNSNAYDVPSSAIEAKYQAAYDSGMVHFAAAGNNGNAVITWPASLPIVNAVAALDPDGTLTGFSCYGQGLDFSAPGIDVYTTDRTGAAGYVSGDYVYVWGTSFASPYAAGVAALVLSAFGSYTPSDVEARMQRTCRDLGAAGYDTNYGWGFVNAWHGVTSWVTFRVDMRVQMRSGSFRRDLGDAVTVQGTFNFWANTDTLTDPDADSIYAATLDFTSYTGHLYKFWKTLRGARGGEASNRFLDVWDGDSTLAAPYFNNEGPPTPAVFAWSPSFLSFGNVVTGDSLADSVWVKNTGGSALGVSSAAWDDPAFRVSPGSGSVPPGDSLLFRVWFAPSSPGPASGHLVFVHDAAGSPDTVGGEGEAMLTLSFPVRSGWNIVSVPLRMTDYRKTVLFPAASGSAWGYSGTYGAEDTLSNGVGYWLKFPAAGSVVDTGGVRLSDTLDLPAGWSMVGTLSGPLAASPVVSDPPGSVVFPFYGFGASGYEESDTLHPGRGYWVKLGGAARVFLSLPSSRPPGPEDLPGTEGVRPRKSRTQ